MADWPFWAAVHTAKQGMSGRAGLSAYRESGGRVANQTWFRMVGEARAMLAQRGDEISRPLNRRPTGEEIVTWHTRKKSGFIQQVEVMARDRETGAIIALPYSVKSQTLMSRQRAIDEALSAFTPEGTDGEKQQILGAIHTGTYQMIPSGD